MEVGHVELRYPLASVPTLLELKAITALYTLLLVNAEKNVFFSSSSSVFLYNAAPREFFNQSVR